LGLAAAPSHRSASMSSKVNGSRGRGGAGAPNRRRLTARTPPPPPPRPPLPCWLIKTVPRCRRNGGRSVCRKWSDSGGVVGGDGGTSAVTVTCPCLACCATSARGGGDSNTSSSPAPGSLGRGDVDAAAAAVALGEPSCCCCCCRCGPGPDDGGDTSAAAAAAVPPPASLRAGGVTGARVVASVCRAADRDKYRSGASIMLGQGQRGWRALVPPKKEDYPRGRPWPCIICPLQRLVSMYGARGGRVVAATTRVAAAGAGVAGAGRDCRPSARVPAVACPSPH
jgi:hypothetical protein